MRGVRRWLVPFVVVASMGVVTVAGDAGAVEPPPSGTHYFKPDSEVPDPDSGDFTLIKNRRPTNTSYLATGDATSLVEDTLGATVGYDQGFLTQPEDASTQTVRRIVQMPPADASGETVATATGFFSSFESPDLVVLRGDSRRWSGTFDPNSTDPTMSLTWYGPQSGAFSTPRTFDLTGNGVEGRPVGVAIVSGTADDNTAGNSVVVATTRGVYAFRNWAFVCDGAGCRDDFGLLGSKEYPAGTTVLALQHNPFSRLSAIEQFDEEYDGVIEDNVYKNVLDMFGVLLSNPSVTQPGKRSLSVEFLRVKDAQQTTHAIDTAIAWTPRQVDAAGTADLIVGVPTGGDLRYGVGNNGGPGHEVRVDINVTLPDRSTRQYTGDQIDPSPNVTITSTAAAGLPLGCISPATGFDAAYFDAFGSGRRLEAHVQCATPRSQDLFGTFLGYVSVGGYHTSGTANGSGTAALVQNSLKLIWSGGTRAIRPQVSVTLPCVALTRYAVRSEPHLDQRSDTANFSWPSVKGQLESDRAYIKSINNWPAMHRCSAGDVAQGAFPYPRAGNEEVTVLVNQADPSADQLGSLHQATSTTLQTVGMVADASQGSYREHVTSQPMPTGTYLTPLPDTDTIERVRLTGDSKTCLTTASPDEKLDCRPSTSFGAPVPIAVMATPPYIKGSDQRGQITSEFATSTSSSQQNSKATSTSVGVELELGFKAEFETPVTKVKSSMKVSAAVGYDREAEHETTKTFTVTKSNGYGGSLDEDTVIVNLVRYLSYEGEVVYSSNGLGLCDRPDPSSPCEPASTKMSVPVGNVVSSMTVGDLQQDPNTAPWWRPSANKHSFGNGLAETLTHVAGMPGTYLANNEPSTPENWDKVVNDYCLGDLDPSQGFAEIARGTPTPANPFTGTKSIPASNDQILTSDWRAAQAGNGVTSQRANLEYNTEYGESFLQTNSISASVSVEGEYGAGGITGSAKATVSAGGSISDGYSASLGAGTGFSGTVGSIPDERLKSEEFTWRMFVCKRELIPGVPVWVQNYEVIGYNGVYRDRGAKAPEDLGPVVGTSPVRSALTSLTPTFEWSQPEGTVKSYDLELEAIGASDHRVVPAVKSYPDFALASQRDGEEANTYTLEPADGLLPGQLYRWRVTSNNFFYKSEVSDWQYLVTLGDERLSVGDGAVVEGAESNRLMRFPVTLSAPSPHDVTFNYVTIPSTAQPDDFALKGGQATIAAGSTSTSVSIAVRGDLAAEGAESFMFLVTPTAASPVLFQRAVGTGRIIDDEPQKSGVRISAGDASVVEGRGKNRWMLFPVTLSREATADVTVKYETQDQTATDEEDYWAAQGTVTIRKGATSTYVKVKVRGDATVEPDETFRVRLSGSGGVPIQRVNGGGTIIDDD